MNPANIHNDSNRHTRHAMGAIIVDGKHIGDTLRCVHCSAHWVHQTGSGARRGYCTDCKGFICGQAICDTCIPLEARLEGLEMGKSKHQVLQGLDGMGRTFA